MKPITALSMARTWIGLEEVEGAVSHPLILGMLQLDAKWATDDETPWCSAFVNFIAKQADLPRSKSLSARSWLLVGESLPSLDDARSGFDVVVLKRGGANQPGPEVLKAPGHVGFFAGFVGMDVVVVGGNQSDMVSEARYPRNRILAIRRLAS